MITHRYEVLAQYAQDSAQQRCADESIAASQARSRVDVRALKRWLHERHGCVAAATNASAASRSLKASTRLATVYTMRDELAALWERSSASKEQLVHNCEDWCRRAEASGIEALQTFSRRLRCYA